MWESAPSVDALEQIGNHLPLVVHYNGKDYLLDGNTRATLMSAMGADTLLCTYVNLDSITASYSVWDSAKPMQFPFRVQVHYEGNIYDENGNKETTFEATTMAISLTQARSRILNQYWKRVGGTRKRWSIDENKLEIQLTPKEQELWDKYYATPEIPICPRCGRRLTDGKYCPVCDDGEQDYE